MDNKIVEHWIDGYLQAWNSNDPGEIGQLFSEDAAYYTGPFDNPWIGRDAIIQGWLSIKDDPGTFSFGYEILATANRLAMVRGWTKYINPDREYSNIWLIKFDDQGRCEEFTEWWMQKD
jgi:uncharacterized protein (TIGR02246 family)